MAYGDFKDLKRRTVSDKILRDKVFNITKNPKYDRYQRGLASVVYNFFDKKLTGSGLNIPLEFNEQLAKELHKPIIRKFKKRRVYSGLRDNIWGADLADMQLISNFDKGFRLLLCAIDIFSKYAWVVPSKDKKGISIVNAFAERFIRTLKATIYKYMTAISRNVYIDKLDDIVNEYNNTYHRAIKMKPVDVKDNTYTDFEKEVNNKDPQFKIGDHVRISKYKNIFAK